MKSFINVLLFFAGLAISISGACAIICKLFKKHCKVNIEFNPSEENSRTCECDEEHCKFCNPSEDNELQFSFVDEEI